MAWESFVFQKIYNPVFCFLFERFGKLAIVWEVLWLPVIFFAALWELFLEKLA